MRVENIDAASHPQTPRSASKEGLIDQRAGRMRSDAWHGHPPGNLGELGGGGNRNERQIGGAGFGWAVCLKEQRTAVRGGSQIITRSVLSRNDEPIRRACIPHGGGAPRSRTTRKEKMSA